MEGALVAQSRGKIQ